MIDDTMSRNGKISAASSYTTCRLDQQHGAFPELVLRYCGVLVQQYCGFFHSSLNFDVPMTHWRVSAPYASTYLLNQSSNH